ncbi:class I adenylate-forming enzyme family protein [Allopusillimonas ginsengisoli]|uniref:class I adenylate-forming enzyme family protein n=1 Tax=Allopusillimonas ginsengisoli TaxID=453575 RepID=UPI0039C049F2
MYPIELFFKATRQFREKTAIRSPQGNLTFEQLANKVNSLAVALQYMDATTSSRVGVCGENTVEHVVCLLAVMAAGKTWVPLNSRNAVSELNRTIAFTEPSIVIATQEYLTSLDLSAVPHRIAMGIGEDGVDTVSTISAQHVGEDPASTFPSQDAAQAIKFTGGSTGTPKGVVQPYRAWLTTAINQIHEYAFDEDDRYLIAAPVTHGTSTYLIPILACGGCLVFPRDNRPASLLQAFQEQAITTTFIPPTLIYMLMAEGEGMDLKFPALRHLIYGGAPMPAQKIRRAREFFGPVLETTYGQTEAPQIVTVMRARDFEDEDNWRSVGRQALLSEVAIMDTNGQLLPSGEVGEIVVRGDLVMAGYWKMPEKTAETIVAGWLHTGDRGYIDDRGFLYLKDRLRDVVISGGFNVYPIDVESILDQHPAVHESAVFGIEDDKWGEAVHAAIQLKPGMTVEADELTTFSKLQLGSVKTPKVFHFFDSLPRSIAGKVHKPTIKEMVMNEMQ